MEKFLIKGYGDAERRLTEKQKIVMAKDIAAAWDMAVAEYPEYKEIGVYAMGDENGKGN